MSRKGTKKREYLNLYNLITDKNNSIAFRLNPDEDMTKELFNKYENAEELSETELNNHLKSELESTVYINHENKSEKFEEKDVTKLSNDEKIELLKKVAKIRECDII
ncbi:MAG: hypothetical protein ACTHVE_01390 [Senegalia sp. (in: firmicutes)]|uniref:hypothetical protein n=1 Tax=Senegalia sp. (in: firmicutes) TaxID=1924098 RepID=UPI003F9E03B1